MPNHSRLMLLGHQSNQAFGGRLKLRPSRLECNYSDYKLIRRPRDPAMVAQGLHFGMRAKRLVIRNQGRWGICYALGICMPELQVVG